MNYTAKNVTKKYETTGQLYWDFYSVENISSIKVANLNISFIIKYLLLKIPDTKPLEMVNFQLVILIME